MSACSAVQGSGAGCTVSSESQPSERPRARSSSPTTIAPVDGWVPQALRWCVPVVCSDRYSADIRPAARRVNVSRRSAVSLCCAVSMVVWSYASVFPRTAGAPPFQEGGEGWPWRGKRKVRQVSSSLRPASDKQGEGGRGPRRETDRAERLNLHSESTTDNTRQRQK